MSGLQRNNSSNVLILVVQNVHTNVLRGLNVNNYFELLINMPFESKAKVKHFKIVCLSYNANIFHAVPWVCLQFVIVVFPDHAHLLFFIYGKLTA